MLRAELLGLAGRMQRIAEEQEAEGGHGLFFGAGDEGAVPAAHRAPPEDEASGRQAAAVGQGGGGFPGGGQEDGRAIGSPPAGGAVGVVEAGRGNPGRGEAGRDGQQGGSIAVRPGAVGEEYGPVDGRRDGPVVESGHRLRTQRVRKRSARSNSSATVSGLDQPCPSPS